VSRSYKIALAFAIALHVALFVFLFIKFALPHRYTISPEDTIVNATVVSAVQSQQAMPPSVQPKVLPPKPKVLPKPPPLKPKALPKLKPEIAVKKPPLKQEKDKELQQELKAESAKIQKELLQKNLENELKAETRNLRAREAQNKTAMLRQEQGEIDKYKALVLQAISSNWVQPEDLSPNLKCVLLVDVAPRGVVLDVKIIETSGNPVLDRSAKAAVLKSSPLPVPEEPNLFDNFRNIKLTVRPNGISNN